MIEMIISGAITGIGSGAGVAVGTYFAQKAIIKHLDKIENKLRETK